MPNWLWHPFLVVAIALLGLGGAYQALTGRRGVLAPAFVDDPLTLKVLGWLGVAAAVAVALGWLATS